MIACQQWYVFWMHTKRSSVISDTWSDADWMLPSPTLPWRILSISYSSYHLCHHIQICLLHFLFPSQVSWLFLSSSVPDLVTNPTKPWSVKPRLQTHTFQTCCKGVITLRNSLKRETQGCSCFMHALGRIWNHMWVLSVQQHCKYLGLTLSKIMSSWQ